MSVLSTLRLREAADIDLAFILVAQSEPPARKLDDHATHSAGITPSSVVPLSSALMTVMPSIGTPFTSDRGFKHQTHIEGIPMDGDKVWYCSNCTDGPFGVWYSQCPSCDHHRCASCTVEEN